jgi:lactoylglutathione lyase
MNSKNGDRMKIEHIAIWTKDLESLKKFYEEFFGATSGSKYVNEKKKFESYFLSFADGPRLELMTIVGLTNPKDTDFPGLLSGYVHMAIAVGSKETVDELTERIVASGQRLVSGPRTTGDGYYESVIQDPDGNLVEITV